VDKWLLRVGREVTRLRRVLGYVRRNRSEGRAPMVLADAEGRKNGDEWGWGGGLTDSGERALGGPVGGPLLGR
jgi:hypothetical protein